MRRGEIWWASLGDAVGSSPGFRHPVLIVQDRNEDGTRRSFETPVARPQRQSGPMRRCQQMHVHPAEALSSEAMSPEEIEHFSMLDDRRARQRGEQVQYFVPAHQRATSQLTDDEGVRPHRVGFEVAGQAVASISKVIDPDRGDA